jgi:ABC-type Fe3+-hydroxamate transport system substrate-binding protein
VDYIDQMGRTITLKNRPRRIISTVPSQTELLFHLGLVDEVVGITWFCIHPSNHFRSKAKVGGTKKLNFETIAALQPYLIIANKEENDRGQIEELAKHYPVWISDVETFEDALMMVEMLGEITGRGEKAHELCGGIIEGFTALDKVAEKEKQKAAYLIWRNPWMGVGKNTFIDEMMNMCGFDNVLKSFETHNFDTETDSLRYPRVYLDELKELHPDVVLLSSEPFPFKDKHIAEIKEVLPCAEVRLVDGEMFSWYGNRLIHSAKYFKHLMQSFGQKAYA